MTPPATNRDARPRGSANRPERPGIPQPTAGSYRAGPGGSARDVFITVYGRIPVLEALRNPAITVDKVLLVDTALGTAATELLRAAAARRVPVHRVPQYRVTQISNNGRQDQGVVADVQAPAMQQISGWAAALSADAALRVLVLDGVSTPGNVGMIIRSATAAGIDHIVVPRSGTPDISPMVIKASAGVAFVAPILRSRTADEAVHVLSAAGFTIYGLRADNKGTSIFEHTWAHRGAFVLGAETAGVSDTVAALVDEWVTIPHVGAVESLNVAAAAAVVSFELLRTHPDRRRRTRRST